MLRIALLAPIDNSLYARLIAHHITQEAGLELGLVLVRSIYSLERVQGELRRDGRRLVDKVYRKLVLGAQAYRPQDQETLPSLAQRAGLRDQSLHDLAQRCRITHQVVKDHNQEAAAAALQRLAPDVIVFTGGGLIRKNILEIPRLGVLNCHAGLLPPYRGMDVVEWPLLEMAGSPPQTGITLHFMDRGVDTGPILLRRSLPVQDGDTIESLRTRLEPLQVGLVLEGLRGLRDGSLQPQPQRAEEGRQYFVMHPRLKAVAAARLAQYHPQESGV